jgi:hypothetical protein
MAGEGEERMVIVKVNEGKYLNLARMTYTEPTRKGGLVVHFAVGGGDVGGPSCYTKLEPSEASILQQFLDAQATQTGGRS